MPGKDPMGREHFWFTVVPLRNPEAGTDRHVVDHGYVSKTPPRLDLTDDEAPARFQDAHPISTISFH